jgi:hypothetical protein
MARGDLALVGVAAALITAAMFGLEALLNTGAQESAEPAVDFAHPTRHFRVPNPARLSDADALSIYERIRDDMAAAYRLSQDPVATRFPKGLRAAPYMPPVARL